MEITQVCKVNELFQQGSIPKPLYTYSKVVKEGMDSWICSIFVGEQSWAGDGCSSKQKSKDSAAAAALPQLLHVGEDGVLLMVDDNDPLLVEARREGVGEGEGGEGDFLYF